MIRSLLEVLTFLHGQGIMHRDIKVENILLNQQLSFKLGDLGLAKHIRGEPDETRVGTPIYFAPEMVLHKAYDEKVDVWALGCVCYNLAALRHPFQDATIDTLASYVIESQPPPLKNYSPRVNELISNMLMRTAEDRPSAA